MSRSVRINVIANFVGTGWSAFMSFIFVPVYISYIGIEAYGVIGLFVSLQVWMTVLDMGLGPTINREMARWRGGRHTARSIRNLFRSAELICAGGALLAALVIFLASDWLTYKWLRPEQISASSLSQALSIAGSALALRWMTGLYRSALLGLQEQVWLNGITVAFATLRGGGAVAVLALVSPTITAFFAFQALVSSLELLAHAVALERFLPPTDRCRTFSLAELRKVWRFSAGVAMISTLAILLTQVDKIVLSKLLPLAEFGHYALAGTVATALLIFVGPIASAIGPRLASIVAQGRDHELVASYHRYAQLICITVAPGAIIIAMFSDRLLLLWTRDPDLTGEVAPLVTVLVVGTMFNAFMNVPYLLQLAVGWTRFALITNLVAVAVLLPALLLSVPVYGAIGAATIWLVLNAGYVCVGIPIMHHFILRGELLSWYTTDTGMPLLTAVTVAFIGRIGVQQVPEEQSLLNAGLIAATYGLTLLATILAAPSGRAMASTVLSRVFGWHLTR